MNVILASLLGGSVTLAALGVGYLALRLTRLERDLGRDTMFWLAGVNPVTGRIVDRPPELDATRGTDIF